MKMVTMFGGNGCSDGIMMLVLMIMVMMVTMMKIIMIGGGDDDCNVKGALQSDLRMCTNEPTFYDTNSLTMFWVLAKPDCCFLIIYYTLEA